MTAPTEAYPLTWPANRPRARTREYARFRQPPLGLTIRQVQDEVARLGGSKLVISSNLPTKRNGVPYATQAQPSDRGVAVYFDYKKKAMCFACDRWNAVEDNMRAVAKTIDALRGIERWGSGQMVEQAFTGFTALPAPEQPWQVLGVEREAALDTVLAAYRRLAAKHHPDRGGDEGQMARINWARDTMTENLESKAA